jgi:hypothetical protein
VEVAQVHKSPGATVVTENHMGEKDYKVVKSSTRLFFNSEML